MHLVLPSVEYKKSFIEAVREFQEEEPNETTRRYFKYSVPEFEANFDTYVQELKAETLGLGLPVGYVPNTLYWLTDGDEYIGRVTVRHRLNEHLESIGGHIGYDIRPSRRKQGYGSKILELALPKAKELGIKRVLITCDETNLGSRRVIEKNGGVFENKVPNPETGIDKLRYWITL